MTDNRLNSNQKENMQTNQTKHKATKQDLKDIILGAAVLTYLDDIFCEKYPEGIPELRIFEEKIDYDNPDNESLHNESAEELVEDTVAKLKELAEKYNAL